MAIGVAMEAAAVGEGLKISLQSCSLTLPHAIETLEAAKYRKARLYQT